MAAIRGGMIGFVLVIASVGASSGAESIELRENARKGTTTRVVVTLKANGLFRPHRPAGPDAQAKAPKPLTLKVESRLAFDERVLTVGPTGAPLRAARHVRQAAAAINGEVRPTSSSLRPDVALLIAEGRDGKTLVTSPGGPLTRPELELVQDLGGDPLLLPDLLPRQPVAVGERWRAGSHAARALSGYDVLATHALDVTLEAADAETARLRVKGEIRGALFGSGEGVMYGSGTVQFDRKAGQIRRLLLERTETRQPGEVEDGLDVTSTLSVEREPIETPSELSDAVLAAIPTQEESARSLLVYFPPDGSYSLLHGRDWHIWQETASMTVLKRLDRGEVVAYCQLQKGPPAGKGRHQDLAQFREDIRKALGDLFGTVVGEGEVEGDPAGGFRYKLGVRGKKGNLNVLWFYYLVANPEGEQLLATFTLAAHQLKTFDDQDLKMIGSLRWRSGEAKGARP